MYVYGPNKELSSNSQQLGFDPVSAILTGSALKQVFGIGKKAAQLKELGQTARGKYVAQFPPDTSFEKILDNIGPQSGRGQRAGAKNMREDYNALRSARDSELIKNEIASAEDYAAWTVLKWLKMPIGCDPNAKKGSVEYAHCPVHGPSGINIFDKPRLDAWLAEQQKPKAVTKKTPPPKPTPTPVKTVKAAPKKAPVVDEIKVTATPTKVAPESAAFMSMFQPQQPLQLQQPQPQIAQQAPPQNEQPSWLIPAVIGLGVVGLTAIATGKKKGRRK